MVTAGKGTSVIGNVFRLRVVITCIWFIWDSHLRSYLVFSPLCPGVVGEESSGGKENGDDADPEEPVEQTQLPVEDVPDAVDGRAGGKLCQGL